MCFKTLRISDLSRFTDKGLNLVRQKSALSMKDYYKTLGIPMSAAQPEIKKAYRERIKKFHPDRNPTAEAAELSRQLNEAYETLCNPELKAAHDRSLKSGESRKGEQPENHSTRKESRKEPQPEFTFSCESCGKEDATLRVCTVWFVFSLIYYSRKSPTVKILCNGCRAKASLAANILTSLLGWWSIHGFFWTVEALFKNACGGEQPKKNNAGLLKALGYQLYHKGRHREAYEALWHGLKLEPDSTMEPTLEYLKKNSTEAEKRTFWHQFRNWQLHPSYYHTPCMIFGIGLLIVGFKQVGPSSSDNSTPYIYSDNTQAAEQAPIYQNPSYASRQSKFAEPELTMPQTGAMLWGDCAVNNQTSAPLGINTRPTDGNYVVKVVDWDTGEFVAMCFIRSGETLTVNIPLGAYKLKFACGQNWYGEKYLFGPTTSYSFANERLVFWQSEDYLKGHQIELIPQVGGNLKTAPLKPLDF